MDAWMDGWSVVSRWHATGHPSSSCLDCGRGMLTIDLFYSNSSSSRIETQAKNKKSREVIYLQLNEVFCEERDIAFRLLAGAAVAASCPYLLSSCMLL